MHRRRQLANVCIYTAIAGGYDNLNPTVHQTIPCDWLAFLEDEPANTCGWQVVPLQVEQEHPRMRAKWPKLCPHLVPELVGYWYTIWIDGSVQVTSPRFAEDMVSFLNSNGWAMFAHPRRDCLYDELEAHFDEQGPKYEGLPLRQQVAFYRAAGYPEHNGLFQSTVIVREGDDEQVQRIGESWWHECVNWSYADQLSHTPVMRHMGLWCDTIPGHVLRNQWFVVRGHNRND